MQPTRCLGLIGGLGVGATIHYYQSLAKACDSAGRALDIVIANAETSRVFDHVQANDRPGLAHYLNAYIQRLHAAGAQIAVIPAVTPHFAIRELNEISPVPVLNIFEPLNHHLSMNSVRRVSVFGTSYVMQSALFGQLPATVEIVRSQPQEEGFIHKTYVALAQAARATDRQRQEMTAVAHSIVHRDRVDAIILAGTDLSLIFDPATTDFPCIDCAALHLEAIAHELVANPAW